MGEEYKRDITVIATIPRLGPIELYDDMEDLLKWEMSGTGVDYAVTKDAALSYNQDAALKLVTRPADCAEGDTVMAYRSLFQMPPGKRRMELIWQSPDMSLIKYLAIDSYNYDGVNINAAGLRYGTVLKSWSRLGEAGAFVPLEGSGQDLLGDSVWHRLVMEYDRSNHKYIRMISDNMEMDLSEWGSYRTLSGNEVEHLVEIAIFTAGAAQATAYIDDVMVKTI